MAQYQDPYGQPQNRGGQPPYPQQGYGYGPPGYSGPQNPFGPEGDQTFGIVGAVTALLGGVALLVSFTAIDWFKGPRTGFSELGDLYDQPNAPGFGDAYFNGLAWIFLIVGVIAAVLASFPNPALRAFRIIGAVIGFAAAGLTFLAIDPGEGASYGDALKEARVGFYLAVVGFLLVGIGAALGPRKV